MKISFIGCGIYGVALAYNASKNKNNVINMWTHNKETYNNFKKNHDFKNITDKKIPSNINVFNDLESCIKESDLIVITSSASHVRSICENLLDIYDGNTPICIASKGIENETCSFLSDIVKDTLKTKNISVISGPSFAIDILNNEPVGLSLASLNKKSYEITYRAFSNDKFKLRKSKNIYSVQICGAIKNVIAIASGIIDGLGYSESSRAFLITESLNDIKNLLKKLHIRYMSVLSFAGMGDLILTCSSLKSRNYRYGVLIGKKTSSKELEEYLTNNTTEGYYTLKSIKKLIDKKKIKMSIVDIIYDICINKKNPEILSEFLINKE